MKSWLTDNKFILIGFTELSQNYSTSMLDNLSPVYPTLPKGKYLHLQGDVEVLEPVVFCTDVIIALLVLAQ